ncbi:MAG: hypothetical protein ACLRPX_07225 [Ruthenibacterium sp.]
MRSYGPTITADDGQPLVEGVDYELTLIATNTGGKLVVLKTERAVTVTGTSKDNYGLQWRQGACEHHIQQCHHQSAYPVRHCHQPQRHGRRHAYHARV